MTSQSAPVPVTKQDNLTNDDLNEDVNKENVTTNVTHESHEHDGDDTDHQMKRMINASKANSISTQS
jgi:hypothetical protein